MFSLHIPPALLILSCSRNDNGPVNEVDGTPQIELESSEIRLAADKDLPVRIIDIFIYDAHGTGTLEYHARTERPDTLELLLKPGDKSAAVIANCPYSFNIDALRQSDSMELIRMTLDDDDPSCPVMTGSCEFGSGQPCSVILEPLLSKVVLAEVTNNMDNYLRLEDPRAYLTNVNSSAEMFRQTGFRPYDTQYDTVKVALPFDVGMYPQYPGTTLWCYPNDSETPTVGTPATALVLECEVNGRAKSYEAQLPPIKRNATVIVSLTVDAPDIYSFEII